MSRAGATHGEGSAGPARIAVLHRQGERWRLLVAQRRGQLSIVEARTIAGEPWASLPDAAEQHGVERIVVVAPGRATVARCAGLPVGNADEMAAAVSLMGEAQLPESLPPHRRAGGVIPDTERPGFRTALMTGWNIESGEAPVVLPENLEDVRITWTTPIAALAVLRGETGAALYADPGEHALSMIAGGAEKTFARVLVEDAAGGFWRAVAQVASETAGAVGAATPQVPATAAGAILRLDPRSIAALRGAVRELPERAEWLNDYGIALGAALLATSDDPLLHPLAQMQQSAPVIREPAITSVVGWLSSPRHAWGVVAASVALMLLAPLAFGWARLGLINAKASGGLDRIKARGQSAWQQAMIEQLGVSRWPMTKLMADVSDCAPQGVIVESLRIATDQGVTIQGSAESTEQVSTMLSNLSAIKVFSNIKPNRVESTGSSVAFDIGADVVNPYLPTKPVDDWATKTLAVRMYGDGASNTATPSGGGGGRSSRRGTSTETASARERDGGGGGRRNRDRSEEGGGGGRREARAERPSDVSSTKSAPANPADAPKALTDEQIGALDMTTSMREMVARRTFSQKPGLEAATKGRLEDEVNRLKAHLDVLRAGGKPTAAPPAASGPSGATGSTGATGVTGASGPSGKPGDAGPSGPTSDTGGAP